MNRLRLYVVALGMASASGLAMVEFEDQTPEQAIQQTLDQVRESDLENQREEDRLRQLRNAEFFRTGGTWGNKAESDAVWQRYLDIQNENAAKAMAK